MSRCRGAILSVLWRVRIRTEYRDLSAKELVCRRQIGGSGGDIGFLGRWTGRQSTRYYRPGFERDDLCAAGYRCILITSLESVGEKDLSSRLPACATSRQKKNILAKTKKRSRDLSRDGDPLRSRSTRRWTFGVLKRRNPRRMTLRPTLIASVLLFAALVSATVAASAERGMRKSLQEDPPAVDLSALKTLSAVVEKLAQKKIVYVGEEHDKFSHHQVQLEVLRGLYQQTPKLAVGMEMFQRPFQKALDDYIAGAID